jgi:dTDP-4-amino-4,6-dideoxygalactose transaminase
MGKPVKELETELAEYVGVKHCISCANGTDALSLALKVWGIGKGDAIFVPDFTFFSSAEVISLEGATPIFVDVDRETFNMDSIDLEKKIKQVLANGKYTPKVIITVDLFGLPANYPAIRNVADTYNLYILEDGAQGFGGKIGDKRACSFGDISTTSFFPAKPLGCYGDGGAVFTDNDEWAALADSFRVHGKGMFKYDNVRIGMNSRLDTLQAAILKVKFNAFKAYEVADINKAAVCYTEKLKGKVNTPVVPEGYYSSWAQYTIRLGSKEERDALQSKLKEHGIPSMVYYPTPMHAQTAYKNLDSPAGLCPVADELCQTVLSLPIHPYISEEDIENVCNQIIG